MEDQKIQISVTPDDLNNLEVVNQYLISRPMSEVEGIVYYVRSLISRIKITAQELRDVQNDDSNVGKPELEQQNK